jgi:hypothetical protein
VRILLVQLSYGRPQRGRNLPPLFERPWHPIPKDHTRTARHPSLRPVVDSRWWFIILVLNIALFGVITITTFIGFVCGCLVLHFIVITSGKRVDELRILLGHHLLQRSKKYLVRQLHGPRSKLSRLAGCAALHRCVFMSSCAS